MPDDSGGRQYRILVVDDNVDAAAILARLLQLQGYVAETVVESTRTLDHLKRFAPDAVLLDIAMPSISGYELAVAIRKLPGFEKLLLVAVSGFGDADHKQRSIDAGIDHHLLKPVQFATLQQILTSRLR